MSDPNSRGITSSRGQAPDPVLDICFENDGVTVHKDCVGFEAGECEITSFVEASLNATEQKKKYKPEYYKKDKRLTVKDRA